MNQLTVFLVIAILLTSCANVIAGSQTLSQAKAELNCVDYANELDWRQVSEKFGMPDKPLLPESGSDLTKNTRLYKDKIILFHTETREVKDGDRIRFREVVTGIEICKEK